MTKPVSSRPKVCKRMFLVIICILFMTNIFAQVGISTTSITPDPTSILELRSTTLGFLAPRMTTTQRDAITSPATGLLIYNTTTNQLNYYSGSAWQVVTGGGQSQLNGTGFVKASGTTISYDNSTYLTSALTSFSKTDNYGITSSVTNSTTTPTHTIGVDTTLISSRLWRQKGIDSLSAIIATKGTGTVTSVTSATTDATVATTTTTPVITIVSAPKLTTARTIQGVSFDGTANINPVNGTGFVKASGATLSYDNSTYLTTAVTSFSKTDNYGITSSLTNPTTTPTHTIGVDTTLISSRLWRQKGIDSLSAIIATKGTGTVTSVTSADANAAIVTTTTTPLITIVSAPKLQTARTINGVFFDGSANITVPSGNLTGDVTSVGNATTLATVNSNVGTFNSVTVNAKGLVTGATITTSELTGKTNADVNSTYPDNSTYFTNVTTANGFPANGNLNGVRKGTVNTQRMQDQLNGSTYERVWIEGTTSWTPWGLYLNTKDFTAKGQMQIASGNNAVGILSVGTDGQVLTADAASINGVKWGAVTGTGNVVLATSPTLVTPILGVASSTSQTINGTAGAGFVELQTQSSNPPTGAANSIRLFSNSLGQYSWIKASDGFSRSLNSVLTANRTFILPDASGTIPVSASGNIALSAAGNISFTGILPVANGGTNSSTTLNNNRIMVSSASTITEAAALTNGQLLIGSTGAAPVAANLTAGNGITITNTAGAITIADNPIISQATATADITTTSTTDVILAGMTITPGAGDYLVFFTGSMENSTSNQQGPVSIYSNGVQIAASEMRAINGSNKAVSVATNAYITGLGAGQAIDIRWNVLSNTGTFHQRTLIVQRVK